MIEPKSLMLGNIITHSTNDMEGGIKDVIIIVNGNLIKELELHPYLGYNPISISSVWFIKFGFAYSNGNVLFKELFEVAITKAGKFYLKGINFGVVEIKYVHQLQNLHYYLTNEHLECSI